MQSGYNGEGHKLSYWGFRLGWITLAGLWVTLMAASWAQAAPTAEKDSEYNFSWLDPDKKIYVLQNRKYTKAGHAMFSAMGGVGWSNPYRNVRTVDPRVSFYFSEDFGVELFYSINFNSTNTTFSALEQESPNALPHIREIRSQYGALLHWVPWYAKINVFNQILHFDWYFSGGAGRIHSFLLDKNSISDPFTETLDDRFALFAGTGQQYHLSQDFLVRLDFTGAFYQAPVLGTAGESAWFSNYNFGIGLGYRL